MKLRTLLAAASMVALAAAAQAEGVKVGMITTLSGGGAGLGIDVRDGFCWRSSSRAAATSKW